MIKPFQLVRKLSKGPGVIFVQDFICLILEFTKDKNHLGKLHLIRRQRFYTRNGFWISDKNQLVYPDIQCAFVGASVIPVMEKIDLHVVGLGSDMTTRNFSGLQIL